MSQLTCLNCQVSFKEATIQRDHYKSDWHRYNLKRKVADLPPVTAEEFVRRLVSTKLEAVDDKRGVYCSVCKKPFGSKNAFNNHLQSKKHLELDTTGGNIVILPSDKNDENKKLEKKQAEESEMEVETDSEVEELDSDEWDDDTQYEMIVSDDNPAVKNNCMFCDHHSASVTKNIKHMSSVHSFFIPYVEYLSDAKGLLVYLSEKITAGRSCLWCDEAFGSIDAVRKHMADKGHAKIKYDTEASLEYLDFYQFQGEDEEEDEEEIKETEVADGEDLVLKLPSGALVYHKSLYMYFKQNPVALRQKTTRTLKIKKTQSLIKHYRQLGWSPTEKEAIKRKMRDIKYLHHVQAKYETNLNFKANKLSVVRPQVMF